MISKYKRQCSACSAYKDYSSCLFKKTEDLCGSQSGYVHFENVRYFIGEVRRKHDKICRPIEHECNLPELLNVLSECRGFLLQNEPANPSDFTNLAKATYTCNGLQQFKNCVNKTIINVCVSDEGIPKSNEVAEYRELAVLKYKWACEVVDQIKAGPQCKDKNLEYHLRQCSGFLSTIVEPITQDFVSAPEQLSLACQFSTYYQQCVQSFLKKEQCKNSVLLPAITKYTQDLFYKYTWTCKKAGNYFNSTRVAHME